MRSTPPIRAASSAALRILVLLAAVARSMPAVAAAPYDGYVGAAACRPCHEDAWKNWTGSHHARAMAEPTATSVAGDFGNKSFEHGGSMTSFRRDGDAYVVNTAGPDGIARDYPVRYVFGIDPLQQLLLELPGGRLQAFTVAWDSRVPGDGGGRWFDLLADGKTAPGDPLHWTGYLQNWNLQCAACHSTALRKNFDPGANTYATTFAEINVACEACHGAGAAHVDWAKATKPPFAPDGAKGFGSPVEKWSAEPWRFTGSEAAIAMRATPPPVSQVAICAPCHSRRTQLDEDAPPDASLYEGHRPAWLGEPHYFADGQQHGEVYVWGSFVQSKMARRGVTCTDCHDSHSVALRAPGNALCATCHRASVFDSPAHHHHAVGSTGSQCVECHMPARTYMRIDARRDHAIQVPRPDLAAATGAPDACTTCHDGKSAGWAAEAMDRFYTSGWRSRASIAQTMRGATTGGALGARALVALAGDSSQAPFVRASALAAARNAVPADLRGIFALLREDEPGLRLAAVDAAAALQPDARVTAVAPLLSDPVHTVRAAAGALLADVPASRLDAAQAASRDRAVEEYTASQLLNADQPFANVNLGNLYASQARVAEARAAFRRAIAIDPHDTTAYVNLADLERATGDEDACAGVLGQGLSKVPDDPALRHARGLSLVRRGLVDQALADLEAAARLDASTARYDYVHAVALDSAGRNHDAITSLQKAEVEHPYDTEILTALVTMLQRAKRDEAALGYARKLSEVLPDDPSIARLLRALGEAAANGNQAP